MKRCACAYLWCLLALAALCLWAAPCRAAEERSLSVGDETALLDAISAAWAEPETGFHLQIEGEVELLSHAELPPNAALELSGDTCLRIRGKKGKLTNLGSIHGDGRLEVEGVKNSKLREGDTFEVSAIVKGYPMYVSGLVRDGKEMPFYVAGSEDGITSVRIL